MGREVVAAIEGESDLELVGQTDIGDDLERAIREQGAQVVVDFTVPGCAVKNTETILEAGACPVIGTTGFGADDIRRLQARADELARGGLIAPNFAIGAVLLMKAAAEASRYLTEIEVIELHHQQKLDAPSGTALKTVEMIHAARVQRASSSPDHPEEKSAREKEQIPGVRGGRYLDIPVHSVRLPGFVAHQEVLLGGPGQVLTLRHDATSRSAFMPGVILAVRTVPRLRQLYYGLEQILEL
jgi:4-hydroxy-tetrahydrodipicolinate reductase